ncbi:MobQ family relaxase [Lentibacillus salicampi]|uniref:Conjugal transfer protein TraA n=1 Tax=Lentibacillus salicampi TaxID=175306 RepID=A0A4Y9AAW6_9BACI|nr:MobQ family relaxase [Lentibacillus salicampi]TFJ91514.1 conjugal transfer protein TraA [Lentibacillus salicampi]
MSTYYCSVNVISRGKGQSAVASASYRSGEPLYSELDMEMKSYKKRTVQPETFIEAPDNAPEWVYNRERLWNEVEWYENKSVSRLAREVRLALPIELDNNQQHQLLEEYVKENFADRGMVADVSIHRDVAHNPHAHVLLTTRPFKENGEWGNKQKREYIKDENGDYVLNKNGKKKFKKVELTDWDYKKTTVEWRKNLAEKINQYYKDNGINEKVSHESYEKQGLDKIPKHRLNRTEYQTEKRLKEDAAINGLEYKPRTYFAKLNEEIEEANSEIELLNKKVAHLSNYRENVKKQTVEELESIRDKISLSENDWKSLKIVAKRTNGFVDITNAKETLDRLDYWKQKIMNEKHEIVAMGKTLEKAKLVYKDNPKDVLMYGFIPNKFKQQYREKMNEYESKIDDYNTKVRAYNEVSKHSKRAFEIQKVFTNEEFKYLYPNFAGSLDDNDKAMELKNAYIENFKQGGQLLSNDIPEVDRMEYTDSHVQANKVLQEWKETNHSLLILERTKAKHQREYGEQYRDWDAEKVFNKSLKFTNTKEQIQAKENEKDNLSVKIDRELKTIYPAITDNTLSKMPSQSKARVLEIYVKGESTGEFSKDVAKVKKDIKTDLQKDAESNMQHDTADSSSKGNAGDLFSSIINNAQHEGSNKHDELERQRQKAKKSKVRKHRLDIGENEL